MTGAKALRGKTTAFLAIAAPVLAGLAYMAAFGAPAHYLLVNGVALALAFLWIALGARPASAPVRRAIIALFLALLFLPLATGPYLNGIARWLPLGPFILHAGSLLIPALVVLCVDEPDYTAPILLAALLAALLQPDAASGFALTFAAVGLHDRSRDWKTGLTAVVGFVASLVMAVRGDLPPQPFVERVLVEAAGHHPAFALVLFITLAACFALILFTVSPERRVRLSLAGSLFGFSIVALMENYPSILIGYGAAPILGYGLALGLVNRRAQTA